MHLDRVVTSGAAISSWLQTACMGVATDFDGFIYGAGPPRQQAWRMAHWNTPTSPLNPHPVLYRDSYGPSEGCHAVSSTSMAAGSVIASQRCLCQGGYRHGRRSLCTTHKVLSHH